MRIGVDLGGTKIEFAAFEDDGTNLASNRISSPQNSYRNTLVALKEGVDALELSLGKKGTIGIGIPGTISPHTGLVKGANSTWLIGNPIKQDLEELLGRPVRIANDANCFTLSEATDGSGAGHNIVFGVIIGTGVGGGLCVNGELIEGLNGITGEWGHSPLPLEYLDENSKQNDPARTGRTCYCGKLNCIETYLSGPGFAKSYFEQSGVQIDPPEIIERLTCDDKAADSVLSSYEGHLARALAGVINIVDPDVVVLGGGLSNVFRLYETVPKLWQHWCFSDQVSTSLEPPKHGDSSGVRGAAWLWPPDC
ncbi:MAG: hypothetical protein CMM52_04180 [Rhodospirillaceae bacterium]|nr:hypothetical protein [Rhodospirillaceae bacterium]|tara:strand:- start:17555 stop:18481 length:927 start_codon:yes stop_codon:yes gene_type:complete